MASELIGEENLFKSGYSQDVESSDTFHFVFHGTGGTIPEYAKGDKITVDGNEYWVLNSRKTLEEDGVMWTLEVNATNSDRSPASGITPTYEQIDIDFVETTQPIEFHPEFLSLVQSSAEDATMKAWLKFKASPLSVRLEKKYLDDPDDPDSTLQNLPNTITNWADLYNRGIESYITHLPVVTRIREYTAQPMQLGEYLDKKESPPSSGCNPPTGYGDWLKTCDKATYTSTTGKWQRTEQWTCAAEWPDLLYGGSSS